MINYRKWVCCFFFILTLSIGGILRVSGINYGIPSKAGRLSSYNPDEHSTFGAISEWGKRDFYTSNLDIATLKIRIQESRKNGDRIGEILLEKFGGNREAVASSEKIAVTNALNSLLIEPYLFKLIEENQLILDKKIKKLLRKAESLAISGGTLQGDELKRLNQALICTHYPNETFCTPKWKTYQFLYFHPGGFSFWGGFHLIPVAAGLKVAELVGYIQRAPRDFYTTHLLEADKLYQIGRSLIAFCGILSIALIFLIVRSTYGTISALIATFLFSILPGQIVYSFTLKSDAMMICFLLVSIFFTIKNIQRYRSCHAISAGCFFGVAVATKFTVTPCAILLFLGLFLLPRSLRFKSFFLTFFFVGLSFCLASPYFVVEFPNLILEAFQFATTKQNPPIHHIIAGSGWKSYLTFYLPYAMGWPLLISGMLSLVLLGMISLKQRNRSDLTLGLPGIKFDLLFLFSFVIIYLVTSFTRQGGTHYTLPIQIFLVIFFARILGMLFRAKQIVWKVIASGLLIFVGGYTFGYAIATVKLYVGENVRESASIWMKRNIPNGSNVAVLLNSFHLPSILRSYQTPYKLMESWDDLVVSSYKGSSFHLDVPILSLEELVNKSDFFILTENEVRIYLHPKLQSYFPEQVAALKRLMDPSREVAHFSEEAKFLWMRFPKNYPPEDWLWPNGSIHIYRSSKT